jgi:hypothetical protein
MLKRYEKISSENEHLIDVVSEIRDVLDTEGVDIETVKKRFRDITRNQYHHNLISDTKQSVDDTTTLKKRKFIGVDKEEKVQKRIRLDEETSHDEVTEKMCYVCNTIKPIERFQRMRNKSTGPYKYTNPKKCNSCR